MKKYLSRTMGWVGIFTALCASVSAHAVRLQHFAFDHNTVGAEPQTINFVFWNGQEGTDKKVEAFVGLEGLSCYDRYHTSGGQNNVKIKTEKIEKYTYYANPPSAGTHAQWSELSAGTPICFRVSNSKNNGEQRFSDVFYVESLQNSAGEIHMIYRYKKTFDAKTYDSAYAKKTIENTFYFEGAKGTKYINVSYDIEENWESDFVSFMQPNFVFKDHSEEIIGVNCSEIKYATNRENQNFPFNLKSDSGKKIKKIYNLPVYTLGVPWVLDHSGRHFMCLYKQDTGRGYYSFINPNSSASAPFASPYPYFVSYRERQCLGTIHLKKDFDIDGDYRADWEPKNTYMGQCPAE